jgi:hypothetical protein
MVLTFELGLDWGSYAADVGPILGVIVGVEVVTAFFVEAGLAGIQSHSAACHLDSNMGPILLPIVRALLRRVHARRRAMERGSVTVLSSIVICTFARI